MNTTLVFLLSTLLLTSCAKSPVNIRAAQPSVHPKPLQDTILKDVVVFLALSGGGTRAAAFSYGVIEELSNISLGKNDRINCKKDVCTLMDRVDFISGVSGGAFPAAYYALSRNELKSRLNFSELKSRFLYKDIEKEIVDDIFFTFNFIDRLGERGRRAGKLYDEYLFKGLKFEDLPEAPFLIVNATDLVNGRRFTFTQEQFRCLGSDFSKFKIGYAIAASAALPIAFSPIQLHNYLERPEECFKNTGYKNLYKYRQKPLSKAPIPQIDPTQSQNHADLILRQQYIDHMNNSYLYLSDGGIADNLGLQALTKDLEENLLREISKRKVKGLVVISVDSAINPKNSFGSNLSSPNFFGVLSRATDLLLQRASHSTYQELFEAIHFLRKIIPVVCLSINFDEIENENLRSSLNSIPTRLSLPTEQVDTLISAGKFIVQKKTENIQTILDLIKGPDSFNGKGIGTCNENPISENGGSAQSS